MPQLSIRLPDDLVQLLDERASAEHLTRTDITAAALRAYLGVLPAPAAGDKLDRVIELLETIAGAPRRQTAAPQRQTLPDKPEMQRTTTPPNAPQRTTSDPRFQAVDSEADALIVSLTQQRASLEDIVGALNAAGYRTATGGEWTRSRLRDYRHKLRDSGLLNG
ncbi:ribbon-helix-helix protein, CopG family [Citrobacter freundii]|uniref:ribbon-helix-helix protein, CopG family n=1 Tax=Citrobacter freundii TaxID=546 RepID=UPI002B3D0569|nr:ribbon-helix-helix protein, CopG family [Citrobacter freundii]MEB1038029.1 ribbon-helix-helix protein, CopG family [Citrobacter freundii]